jgi:hypothetical protein
VLHISTFLQLSLLFSLLFAVVYFVLFAVVACYFLLYVTLYFAHEHCVLLSSSSQAVHLVSALMASRWMVDGGIKTLPNALTQMDYSAQQVELELNSWGLHGVITF